VIAHEWFAAVPDDSVAELDEMLASAVAFDAEAGFSTARPDRSTEEDAAVHHLLVSMPPKGVRGSPDLDRLPDVRVVAYLRLDVRDGVGEVQLVVRPEFRSLGVATLLLEWLRDRGDGWRAIPGLRTLRGWSHGGHPAAQRLSWRFGAGEECRIFKTLRLIGGRRPFKANVEIQDRTPASAGPEIAPGHDAAMAPADIATRQGRRIRVDLGGADRMILVGHGVHDDPASPVLLEPLTITDERAISALLSAGLLAAQEQGARIAQLYVDADAEVPLRVSRELGFFHDQSDVSYLLDLQA
jgi:mycothiol synthase